MNGCLGFTTHCSFSYSSLTLLNSGCHKESSGCDGNWIPGNCSGADSVNSNGVCTSQSGNTTTISSYV